MAGRDPSTQGSTLGGRSEPFRFEDSTASRSSKELSHHIMTSLKALLLTVFVSLFFTFSSALKFDIAAHTGHGNKYERCIRNFVQRETLVVVTAIIDGTKGDGQILNMHVRLPRIRGFMATH